MNRNDTLSEKVQSVAGEVRRDTKVQQYRHFHLLPFCERLFCAQYYTSHTTESTAHLTVSRSLEATPLLLCRLHTQTLFNPTRAGWGLELHVQHHADSTLSPLPSPLSSSVVLAAVRSASDVAVLHVGLTVSESVPEEGLGLIT